jgi:hypothetical protein
MSFFPETPVRGLIKNLSTDEEKEMFLNPESLKETISVENEWRLNHAMSQDFPVYKGTRGVLRPVSLWVSRLAVMKQRGKGQADATDQIVDFRNFLQSLTVADDRFVQEGLVGATPPDVLLSCPGIYTGVCRIESVDISYGQRSADGSPMRYVADVVFKEFRLRRKWSADVRNHGIHW